MLAAWDDDESSPVPVVLSLSTWNARGPGLAGWAVCELRDRYSIPPAMSARWLREGRVLPLLDGLDEVDAELREACVAAINGSTATAGLVVSSRVSEYMALPQRLRLAAAVELLPLTPRQVLSFVEQMGAPLAALHHAISTDAEWKELASSPLMLSVMALAFRDEQKEAFESAGDDRASMRRKHVFSKYVERMIDRRGARWDHELRSTLRPVLARLAHKMKLHGATLFALDQLQPSWLSEPARLARYVFWSRTLVAALCVTMWTPWIFLGLAFESTASAAVVLLATLIHVPMYTAMFALPIGAAGTALTLRCWKRRDNKLISNWVLGTLLVWWGVCAAGIPILLRSLGGTSTTDIRLLAVTQWSRATFAARAKKWLGKPLKYAAYCGMALACLAFTALLLYDESLDDAALAALGVALAVPLEVVLFAAPVTVLFGGFTRVDVDRVADPGPRRAVKSALMTAVAVQFVALAFVVVAHSTGWLWLSIGALMVAILGANVVIANGGLDVVAHLLLRRMLARHESIPEALDRFLKQGEAAVLLQRVGGSYRFVHVLLRDVLADEVDDRGAQMAGPDHGRVRAPDPAAPPGTG